MQPISEAHAVAQAHGDDGVTGGEEGVPGGGAGHEDDFFPGQIESGDAFPVVFRADDEFEPTAGQGGVVRQNVAVQGGGVAGVRQFGGDVPLVDAPNEEFRRFKRTVGLDFYVKITREERQKFGDGFLLQKGLSAGDDKVFPAKSQNASGGLFGGEFYPVSPRVFRVAPCAGQIAAG